MSKKRQTANKGKPRAPKTKPDWTHRIFLAARSAGKQATRKDSGPLEDSEYLLMNLVAQALDTGTDKHVLRAIEDLEEAHHDTAAEMVAFWADDAAASLPVGIRKVGGTTDDGEVELFLAPVLLLVDADHAAPLYLPDSPQDDPKSPLSRCATSLRRHGLIGSEPDVTLLPGLYAYADLPTAWATQRGMMRQMLKGLAGLPVRVEQPQQTYVVTRPTLALRFMFFAVARSADDENPCPLLDGEFLEPQSPEESGQPEAACTELDPRLLVWQEDIEQILEECLPGVLSVKAGTPAWWDEAIHDGFDTRNLLGLIAAVTPADDREEVLSSHVAMGLYLVNDNLELRIGVTRDGTLAGSFIWICHRDPEVEVEEAFGTLVQIGVPAEQIQVATDILGDERCPDCGNPYFPSVSGEPLHEQDTPGRSPEHARTLH